MPTTESLDILWNAELNNPWLRNEDTQFTGMGRGVSPPTSRSVTKFTGKKIGTIHIDPQTKEMIITRTTENKAEE